LSSTTPQNFGLMTRVIAKCGSGPRTTWYGMLETLFPAVSCPYTQYSMVPLTPVDGTVPLK